MVFANYLAHKELLFFASAKSVIRNKGITDEKKWNPELKITFKLKK
jgi:hypothetical protein